MSVVDTAALRATAEEVAMVCDAYGLPHSAVALDRHLTNNATATIDNWKAVAAQRLAELDTLRAELARVDHENCGCINIDAALVSPTPDPTTP